MQHHIESYKLFSVIITCVNETKSLIKTLEIVINQNKDDIREIIIVYPERVEQETLKIINEFSSKNKFIVLLKQKSPHVGGAIRDAFDIVKGKYVIMMASDLETNPFDVKRMIKKFKLDPKLDIVTASRWTVKWGSFVGYGYSRVLLNYLFNKIFSMLYNTSLSDMTFGFRGFRTQIIQSIKWDNYKHSFFFETIIKPLILDCRIIEIPTKWVAREDGKPQISRDYFSFILIGIKFLFWRKNNDKV